MTISSCFSNLLKHSMYYWKVYWKDKLYLLITIILIQEYRKIFRKFIIFTIPFDFEKNYGLKLYLKDKLSGIVCKSAAWSQRTVSSPLCRTSGATVFSSTRSSPLAASLSRNIIIKHLMDGAYTPPPPPLYCTVGCDYFLNFTGITNFEFKIHEKYTT